MSYQYSSMNMEVLNTAPLNTYSTCHPLRSLSPFFVVGGFRSEFDFSHWPGIFGMAGTNFTDTSSAWNHQSPTKSSCSILECWCFQFCKEDDFLSRLRVWSLQTDGHPSRCNVFCVPCWIISTGDWQSEYDSLRFSNWRIQFETRLDNVFF